MCKYWLHVLSVVLVAAVVNAIICPDSSECPDDNTCCKLESGMYGCCPLPDATCCSDGKHCCPEGYKCELSTQTCTKGNLFMKALKRIPAVKVIF